MPNNVPVDAKIITPTTTGASEPTVATTSTTIPTTTVPDTTESDTTEPDSTDPDTTDSVPASRNRIVVAAANGSNVAGAALRVAGELEDLCYVGVLPLNGTDIEEFTTLYFADGFEAAALRMADDLDLLPEFVALIEDSPNIADLSADIELLVYIGRDCA